MIHTKEQANVFYVYLTAYRSINHYAVNEKFTKGMTKRIQRFPGTYGSLINSNVEGCYWEDGAGLPTVERTLIVKCTKQSQVAELTWMACKEYDQDAVLVVNSQTHTATLCSIEMNGDYPLVFPEVAEEKIGKFVKQDTGAVAYSIINGERWEVV